MRNTLSIGPPRLLTVGQAPTLASDARSKKREAFDREIKMKQEAEALKLMFDKQKSQVEEDEEITNLRNSLVF